MISIPQHILAEMHIHAAATAPEECCGLLAGRDGAVTARFPISNLPSDDPAVADLQVPPDRRLRYVMDPKEQLAAFKTMRQTGVDLLAIYHSHPHSPAYPSATDIRLAFYSDVHFLIVSPIDRPTIRAFLIVDGQVTEAPIRAI